MTPAQLRHRRIALGLTPSEFAALLGNTSGDILRWESGVPPIPDDFVLDLAIAYAELHVESKAPIPRPRSDRRDQLDDTAARV